MKKKKKKKKNADSQTDKVESVNLHLQKFFQGMNS